LNIFKQNWCLLEREREKREREREREREEKWILFLLSTVIMIDKVNMKLLFFVSCLRILLMRLSMILSNV